MGMHRELARRGWSGSPENATLMAGRRRMRPGVIEVGGQVCGLASEMIPTGWGRDGP
jgi:hypothetical protein